MPLAPRDPSTPPTARAGGDLEGGVRPDLAGVDATAQIAASQTVGEAEAQAWATALEGGTLVQGGHIGDAMTLPPAPDVDSTVLGAL
jgi:hypothetical protein